MKPEQRSRYPANWKDISIYVRFTLAKGKCQLCGIAHKTINKKTGRPIHLTCAHIDRNTDNNKLDNLISLCQPCHLKYDRRYNIMNRRARDNL